MTKKHAAMALLPVVLAVGCRACGGGEVSGPIKEITSESIERVGDTWQVAFVSNFAAPVDQVFDAFKQPERLKEFVPENVLKSDVVASEGNTKTIDLVARLDILPPGFKVQNLRVEYTYLPDQKRITGKTINFKLADIATDYTFEPTADGKGTVLRFKQTSKDKAPMLVESLQKGAIRETYVTQVKAVNRALGLEPKEEPQKAG